MAKCDKERTADERLRAMGKYPFIADLVTNTICADLLDYLPRDHTFTGLPVGLGQRFMTAFYVVPRAEGDEKRHYPERMALRLSHHGRMRQDISSELLKHLRYRYELQERALVHHAKLAADSMLGKALELWRDGQWIAVAADRGSAEVERALSEDGGVDRVRKALVEDLGKPAARAIDQEVEDTLEERLRELGDDGLLEHIAGIGVETPGVVIDPRARQLAADLLNRRLYKRVAQARGRTTKDRVYALFGDRAQRRELERKAAAFVGVPEEQVVIWIPDPKMRLKIAEVLVDFGEGIAPYNKYSDRGRDIYRDHEDLWTVTVFVHGDVLDRGLEPAILARLAELMGIEWDLHKPPKAQRPEEWPLALAAAEVLDENDFERDLAALLEDASAQQVAHRASGVTFEDLKADIRPLVAKIRRRREGEESR